MVRPTHFIQLHYGLAAYPQIWLSVSICLQVRYNVEGICACKALYLHLYSPIDNCRVFFKISYVRTYVHCVIAFSLLPRPLSGYGNQTVQTCNSRSILGQNYDWSSPVSVSLSQSPPVGQTTGGHTLGQTLEAPWSDPTEREGGRERKRERE